MSSNKASVIIHGTVVSPWGPISLTISEHGVRQLCFDVHSGNMLTGKWADLMTAYLSGQAIPTDVQIDLASLSAFSRRVLEACRSIPFGHVVSYAQLAAMVGKPHAARAVGHALAHNPVPIIIPCHRVVSSQGVLTGFLGGLPWKRRLLAHEGIQLVHDRVPRQMIGASGCWPCGTDQYLTSLKNFDRGRSL